MGRQKQTRGPVHLFIVVLISFVEPGSELRHYFPDIVVTCLLTGFGQHVKISNDRSTSGTNLSRKPRRAGGKVEVSAQKHTKRDLLEAASRLFEQKGYAGASIREIARACDTSISNIYHHFGNKEGLWQEIRDSSVLNLPQILLAARAEHRDPVKGLKQMLRAHLEVGEVFGRELKIFFIGYDQLDPSQNLPNAQLQKDILEIYIDQIKELRELGYVDSPYPKIVAFNILGVLNWSLRWYREDGKLSAKEVHKEIVAFILRALEIADCPEQTRSQKKELK